MGVSRIPSGNEPCVRYEPRRASDDERIRRVRRDATTRRTARPRATALIEQAKQKREHGPERRIAAFSALPAYAATRRTGASTGAERQRRCESLNSGRLRTGRRPVTLKRIASTKVTRELPRANGSRHGPGSCSARLQRSAPCPGGSGTWSACPVEMVRGGGHVALPAGRARRRRGCRRRRRHPKQRTSYFPIGRGWSKTGRAGEKAQLHHAQNMRSYLEVPALVRQRDLVEKLPQLAATGSSPRALPPRRRAGSQGSEFCARAELLPRPLARQLLLPPRSTEDVVMLHVVESRVVRTGGDRSCGGGGGGGGICGWGGRVGGGGGGGGGGGCGGRSRSGNWGWGGGASPGSHEPLLEVALARNAASRVAHRVDAGRFLGQSGVRMKRPREHLVADDDPAVRVVVPGLATQRVPDELSRAEVADAVPLRWP